MQKGFTLIELLVVIAIVAVLSVVVLFSVSIYINKGKDASLQGNLAVLIPAAESFYDRNSGMGYNDFCTLSIVEESFTCADEQDKWAACSQEFSNPDRAFCVDSRGVKKEICNTSCFVDILECPNDNLIASCP